jgi:maleylacetoacetate isomerase
MGAPGKEKCQGKGSNGNGFGFILAGMKLYNYCRSSASFRVRIALNLKGLPFDYLPVHLVHGEQLQEGHRALSADGLVPVLEVDGHTLTQSMAIIEYLDETRPAPPLLPASALGRAQVRALAQTIACEIHPLNNLRVLKYLSHKLQCAEEEKNTWYRHWVRQGLMAFERQLERLQASGLRFSAFCYGDAPTLADCLLVPQIFNARRFDTDLDGLPLTMAAFDACMALPAFDTAQPSRCPDFTP